MIDAPALVAVRADDIQPAEVQDCLPLPRRRTAERNVGAAAGHVGRDRNGTEHASLRDNLRFGLIVARRALRT